MMNPTINIIYQIIQVLLLTVIGLQVLYIFIFSAAGLFYRQQDYVFPGMFRKIVVLIPCYKEDMVIMEVVSDAVLQDYPKECFDVVVIADSLQHATILDLTALPVKVIEVHFEKSTKSLALNKAMELLPDSYEIAVILDADNLMAPGFLSKINATFNHETVAVQSHRKAKNMNNSLAILDAISEEINNHIFRKGHRVMGLSSAIIGSGMAFNYVYFKNLMRTVTAVGGFDKDIELRMLKEGRKILYLDDAIVLDEKVQHAAVFTNQRRRWISSQLVYLKRDFKSSVKALIVQGNMDYFDKTIQFILFPRILLLGATFVLGPLYIILDLLFMLHPIFSWIWGSVILFCVLTFLFSIPRYFYTVKSLKAIFNLPKGLFLMIGSLVRIQGANKQFIHTEHTVKEKMK
jgi:cellulose synthase/poly-beta-1,6-N-acetylglucosamine synthase-like glycosyltransferase